MVERETTGHAWRVHKICALEEVHWKSYGNAEKREMMVQRQRWVKRMVGDLSENKAYTSCHFILTATIFL